MKQNESHIEKALQSLDGIDRAPANPFLYGKIMQRMQARKADLVYSGKVVLRYVTLIIILTGINTYTMFKANQVKKHNDIKIVREVADEYFTGSKVFEY